MPSACFVRRPEFRTGLVLRRHHSRCCRRGSRASLRKPWAVPRCVLYPLRFVLVSMATENGPGGSPSASRIQTKVPPPPPGQNRAPRRLLAGKKGQRLLPLSFPTTPCKSPSSEGRWRVLGLAPKKVVGPQLVTVLGTPPPPLEGWIPLHPKKGPAQTTIPKAAIALLCCHESYQSGIAEGGSNPHANSSLHISLTPVF